MNKYLIFQVIVFYFYFDSWNLEKQLKAIISTASTDFFFEVELSYLSFDTLKFKHKSAAWNDVEQSFGFCILN